MTIRLTLAALLVCSPAAADNLWVEGSASNSIVDGTRFAISRTLGNFSLDGVVAGVSHASYGDSDWTLFDAGIGRKFGDRFTFQSEIHVGPGTIDGKDITYNKMMLGGGIILSQEWFAQLSDTYVNVDNAVGHIVNLSATRATKDGLTLTVSGLAAFGSSIETRQFGASFKLLRHFEYLAGVSLGQTRNALIINELGQDFGGENVLLREFYAGIGIPLGQLTVLAVFDHLQLDDVRRNELSIVIRVPLGDKTGARR